MIVGARVIQAPTQGAVQPRPNFTSSSLPPSLLFLSLSHFFSLFSSLILSHSIHLLTARANGKRHDLIQNCICCTSYIKIVPILLNLEQLLLTICCQQMQQFPHKQILTNPQFRKRGGLLSQPSHWYTPLVRAASSY